VSCVSTGSLSSRLRCGLRPVPASGSHGARQPGQLPLAGRLIHCPTARRTVLGLGVAYLTNGVVLVASATSYVYRIDIRFTFGSESGKPQALAVSTWNSVTATSKPRHSATSATPSRP
jgi:hypothetical protein